MRIVLTLAAALALGLLGWWLHARAPRELSEGLPHKGQWRHGFALADMNGDGRADIGFGPARKGTRSPAIFLGEPQAWKLWREAEYPSAAYDYGAAASADFDGDGHADLALAT